jgi:GT2 family glycosyltransferase
MRANQPTLSVIVPCFNSERTIRACLSALLAQKTTVAYEVIVVDSSFDQTPCTVQKEFPTVRLIHLDRRTYAGAARNIGVRASRAPFCLMIDSDCVAKNSLIEQMMTDLREDDYAAVGGSLSNGTPGSLSGLTGYLLEFKEFIPGAPKRIVNSVPTANVTYRREVFERHGYFDDDMWLAEDILFNWRICKAGERILFDPAIQVTHLNRTGWKEVLSYQVNLGEYSAKARRIGSLPGDILLRYPALIILMPLVRLLNAATWLAKIDRRMFLKFLFISPMYFIGACLWSVGFFRTAVGEMTA